MKITMANISQDKDVSNGKLKNFQEKIVCAIVGFQHNK